jgi:SAM-dependent methyltransferase
MGKNNKKKIRKKKNGNRNLQKSIMTTDPKVFFKKIGIRPLVKRGEEGSRDIIEKEVLRRCSQGVINQVFEQYDTECDLMPIDLFHSNLKLAKISYGVDFDSICQIAKELAMLTVPPQSEILDIGGGPGHLAFWIAHIFNAASVTVADSFQEMGSEWAKSIKEKRVNFVNSHLPELKKLDGQKFDAVVLSRVLSFIPDLKLPRLKSGLETESYLDSDEMNQLAKKIEKIGSRLKELIKPNGQLIIMESWSDVRILLIGKAFKNVGLHIDFDKFSADRVGINYSAVVFSESARSIPLNDPIYSLSTAAFFHEKYPPYLGTAAESFRAFFKDGDVKDGLLYKHDKDPVIYQNEIIEKEGLLLFFRSSSDGAKTSNIYPGVYILHLMEMFDKWRKEIPSDLIINDLRL